MRHTPVRWSTMVCSVGGTILSVSSATAPRPEAYLPFKRNSRSRRRRSRISDIFVAPKSKCPLRAWGLKVGTPPTDSFAAVSTGDGTFGLGPTARSFAGATLNDHLKTGDHEVTETDSTTTVPSMR